MSEQPGDISISGDDLDVADPARPETSEPEAYDDDATLGGLGGSDDTAGGAG